VAERTEANADAQIGFAAQGLNQGQNDFAHGDGVFAGLDVQVGDAGGAMMDEQFGELFVLRAEAFERAIAAAHAAIGAVFATVIGNFDDSADENMVPKACSRCQRGFFMKCLLSLAV